MRRALDHLSTLARTLRLRAVYTDLDGTLFGPGASLFAAAGGGVTTRAAEAVAALQRLDIALVPVSGRTEPQVREAARVLGADGFIAELGGITSFRGDVIRAYGAYHGTTTPHEAMARSGVAGVLLEEFAGRLQPHAPWAFEGRECTMMFRGNVDLAKARALLSRTGYDWLVLHDNGVINRPFPELDLAEVHAYHLAPVGVDKAAAVAADLARRGVGRAEAIGVGDSSSDIELAPHVGAVFIVAGGAASRSSAPDNVYVTEKAQGDGFAEVVLGLIDSRS